MIIFSQHERCGQWLLSRMPHMIRLLPEYKTIGLEVGGELTAVALYEKYTGHDMTLGLVVEKRATKGFVKEAFRYPFIQLGCRRVSAEVARNNRACISLLLRLGFTFEGSKRDALPGEDVLQYGMLRSECRWL